MTEHETEDTDGAGAEVIYLRNEPDTDLDTSQPDAALEPTGRAVIEVEGRLLSSDRERALDRWRKYGTAVQATGRTVRTVATHRHTKTAAQASARQVAYVYAGARDKSRSRRTERRQDDMRAARRAAVEAGDMDRVQRLDQQIKDRPKQRAEAAAARLHVWWTTGLRAGLVLAGLLVLLSVAALINDIAHLAGKDGIAGFGIVPLWSGLATGVAAVVAAVAAVVGWVAAWWLPLALAGLAGWVWSLRERGRHSAAVPAWTRPGNRAGTREATPITPSAITTALRDLGIAPLRKAIEDDQDAGAWMLSPITLAGCGVEVTVRLPRQVSTTAISSKRQMLAENLDRHVHELHISVAAAARSVTLWIADPGALDAPIGQSPLETDPEQTADFYTGRAPWGQSLRGDRVSVSLMQMHLLITGLSNQGKTAALRSLLLWLLLDRSVELHLADLKGIGDWHMLSGIASTLIEGPSDEHVIEATHMLEWGVEEMNRRLEAHDSEQYPDGVPHKLAAQPGSGFHPLVFVIDEAQVAYLCPETDEANTPYGGQKNSSRFLRAVRQIQNQGRAVNVVLWQGTQDPTDQNLPKLAREGAHIRASLVVGTPSQAVMALGGKAVNAGAAPDQLREGKDKGTVVVTGEGIPLPEGELSMTVRTYYVDGDAAQGLAEQIRQHRGTRDSAAAIETESRDLLVDVDSVLDTDPVPAADVVGALQTLAPHWRPYQALSKAGLAAQLGEAGVRVPSTGNRYPVDPATVTAALAARTTDTDPD